MQPASGSLLGSFPVRVMPKIWKTVLVTCPASCSTLMDGCKGNSWRAAVPSTRHQCSIHCESSRVAFTTFYCLRNVFRSEVFLASSCHLRSHHAAAISCFILLVLIRLHAESRPVHDARHADQPPDPDWRFLSARWRERDRFPDDSGYREGWRGRAGPGPGRRDRVREWTGDGSVLVVLVRENVQSVTGPVFPLEKRTTDNNRTQRRPQRNAQLQCRRRRRLLQCRKTVPQAAPPATWKAMTAGNIFAKRQHLPSFIFCFYLRNRYFKDRHSGTAHIQRSFHEQKLHFLLIHGFAPVSLANVCFFLQVWNWQRRQRFPNSKLELQWLFPTPVYITLTTTWCLLMFETHMVRKRSLQRSAMLRLSFFAIGFAWFRQGALFFIAIF